VGHHTWAIVLSDNFKSEDAMQVSNCLLLRLFLHSHLNSTIYGFFSLVSCLLKDSEFSEDVLFSSAILNG